MDFQMVLESILGSFWICSNTVLKLADLCKYAPAPNGSMVIEVAALCFLLISYDFLLISHVSFRFSLGYILEAILVRFG